MSAFLLTAALTSYLVLQNGDIGSRMVYLPGAPVKPMVPMLTGTHEHGGQSGSGNQQGDGEESEKLTSASSTSASRPPERRMATSILTEDFADDERHLPPPRLAP